MASPEVDKDSVWNDDLPWGQGERPVEPEELVVLTLLPESENENTTLPVAHPRRGTSDWS